jgi:hypothetical protein
MLLETENNPTLIMTNQQCDVLAERIAAVLRQRKTIGEERRRQEQEYRRLNSERALARHYKLRGGFRKESKRRNQEIDRVYDAIMSANAAT